MNTFCKYESCFATKQFGKTPEVRTDANRLADGELTDDPLKKDHSGHRIGAITRCPGDQD